MFALCKHGLPKSSIGIASYLKVESQKLLDQVDAQINALDPGSKDEKKKILTLQKDKGVLEAAGLGTLGACRNGKLTQAEQAGRDPT